MIIRVMKIFLDSSSVYSCHLLVSSASVRSIPFLSFIEPIFAWNVHLVSLIFLTFYCFHLFLFIDRWGRLSYLTLVFFGTLHSDAYIFPFLCFWLLFTAICKASSASHFAFWHFFFLGMVLITASYTMSQTSVHSSSGTLSINRVDLIPWIYLPLHCITVIVRDLI